MSLILGIETSCDETAAAVVKDGTEVLSNEIYSQIETHRAFGGVVPEIASRNHIVKVDAITKAALDKAGVTLSDIDKIAVTHGPGLVGALLVGLSFAKGLAYAARKPFFGVHHIRGHIAANYLENSGLTPPFACLIVSGGHTCLARVDTYTHMEILGQTRDDAAGEAFDKAARAMGLPYPGGVEIDKLAKEGDPAAIRFPRAHLDGSLDFSFSGLKSAVLNYLNERKKTGEPINRADIAASFQQAVVDVLVDKSIAACQQTNQTQLAMAGGVCANSALRAAAASACAENGISLFIPKPIYCTDNAAMIAACAHYEGGESPMTLNAVPSLPLS